ncbi:FAM72 protein-domain-containing protein [Polychytrium aggregatum]|uniref:FAM72 protein-domain-containing protein n=1 Tax=Polychytrium aggregatum TaxID=110093 RepID=UPI0022FDCA51|nr:FAM72 protein-domain-containing protein [Polychytrium aggregatum]KAI9202676.1 FAM72 protein-domain-containing protein [Polychytrium aggregatum]
MPEPTTRTSLSNTPERRAYWLARGTAIPTDDLSQHPAETPRPATTTRATGLHTHIPFRRVAVNPAIHPQFREKAVCKLYCNHCATLMCKRGMKAILLGNTKVELFSTDTPPRGVQLIHLDYTTRNCLCRIRDAACLGCGNVVGYHVTQPCEKCLEACNNGHFWMFHAEGVHSEDRMDQNGRQLLRWESLPRSEEDKDHLEGRAVQLACR